jgi:hypothetical protein
VSAINDALRRASTAAKSPGDSSSAGGPPPLPGMPLSLPPLPTGSVSTALPPRIDETALRSPSPGFASVSHQPRSMMPILFAIAAFLCVFTAAGSYWYAKQHGPFLGKSASFSKTGEEEDAEFQKPAETVQREVESPATSFAPIAAKETTTTPETTPNPKPNATAPASQSSPFPSVTASKPSPAANNGPVRFPPLRLQSIYYRPGNPSVMINGKTLFISDEVSGVTVADISPSSVTLVLSGQTNVLTLR